MYYSRFITELCFGKLSSYKMYLETGFMGKNAPSTQFSKICIPYVNKGYATFLWLSFSLGNTCIANMSTDDKKVGLRRDGTSVTLLMVRGTRESEPAKCALNP